MPPLCRRRCTGTRHKITSANRTRGSRSLSGGYYRPCFNGIGSPSCMHCLPVSAPELVDKSEFPCTPHPGLGTHKNTEAVEHLSNPSGRAFCVERQDAKGSVVDWSRVEPGGYKGIFRTPWHHSCAGAGRVYVVS